MKIKALVMVALVVIITFSLSAQNVTNSIGKPVIDSTVYKAWPSIGANPAISNNGEYSICTLENIPVGSRTLVIQSNRKPWKREIVAAADYQFGFTGDNKIGYFMKPNDSLGLVELEKKTVEYISSVSSFKFKIGNSGSLLAYLQKGTEGKLVLRNLLTGKKRDFSHVKDYHFSNDGNVLILLQKELSNDNNITLSLKLIDLAGDKILNIWSSGAGQQASNIGGIAFSVDDTQMAFIVESSANGKAENVIWHYRVGADRASILVNNETKGVGDNMRIENNFAFNGFSEDGQQLFFQLREKEHFQPKKVNAQVDVWSYTDAKLQSRQLKELGNPSYSATINIGSGKVFRLEFENEHIEKISGNFALLTHRERNAEPSDAFWNVLSRRMTFLISLKDGARRVINMPSGAIVNYPILSPSGKYIIYYDPDKRAYFSYIIESGIVNNITKNISTNWTRFGSDYPFSSNDHYAVVNWLKNDKTVFLYDQNDIWLADPDGKAAAENITNFYGRKHEIELRFPVDFRFTAIEGNSPLVLEAFDRKTKNGGFYQITIGKKKDPECLEMGPYIYNSAPILKAKDVNAYIVRRESATESPNFLFTSDFKSFKPLSDIHPEKNYNWFTTELHCWNSPRGDLLHGVLIKPDNFDAAKKYPVILYYYEQLSDRLNAYHIPEFSFDNINIPTFVSNGYLIFTPDIHYRIGEPGQSAYDAIVSAGKYLAGLPFVDAKRMGLQGHSFGGYETNYIITHSDMFAAALSVSGLSELISGYGHVSGSNTAHDVDQMRLGAAIWERPDLYVNNSPLFRANKVNTPLLMMNNKLDAAVDFSQGVIFFDALRRLGKKVWMLQYDNEAHSLVDERNMIDYSVRVKQFFDHYLKDAPAPSWMRVGIPANKKGIDDGLDF